MGARRPARAGRRLQRAARSPAALFDDLCEGAALCGTTNPDGIDHILARGLETIEPPAGWEPERRELDVLTGLEHRRLRLSDHAPVEARFHVR